MPWTPKDSKSFSRKATTPKKSRMWSKIANSVLSRGGSESSAIRQASGVIKRQSKSSSKR